MQREGGEGERAHRGWCRVEGRGFRERKGKFGYLAPVIFKVECEYPCSSILLSAQVVIRPARINFIKLHVTKQVSMTERERCNPHTAISALDFERGHQPQTGLTQQRGHSRPRVLFTVQETFPRSLSPRPSSGSLSYLCVFPPPPAPGSLLMQSSLSWALLYSSPLSTSISFVPPLTLPYVCIYTHTEAHTPLCVCCCVCVCGYVCMWVSI